jgi:hypothetical protein
MVLYFDSIQFQFVSLIFTFDAFKILLQNFGFVWTDSKLQNFRLGDGESRKSQYRSYLTDTLSGPLMFQLLYKLVNYFLGRHDIQHNDTRYNDIQHKNKECQTQ